MITVNKGEVSIKGSGDEITTELVVAIRGIREMLSEQMPQFIADMILHNSIDMAFKSIDEIQEENRRFQVMDSLKGLSPKEMSEMLKDIK